MNIPKFGGAAPPVTISVSVTAVPKWPTLAGDFSDPDVATIRKPETHQCYGYRWVPPPVVIREGHLVITTGDGDATVLHEIGHLLTRPCEKWYHWNADPIDFQFRVPKSNAGAVRLFHTELKACAIEHVLHDRYYGNRRVSPEGLISSIEANVRSLYRYYGSANWEFNRTELLRFYDGSLQSFDDIHLRWRRLMDEIQYRRWCRRFKLPPLTSAVGVSSEP